MDNGIRSAAVLAAVVCLLTGMAWDRLVRTVSDGGSRPAAAPASLTETDARGRLRPVVVFTYTGEPARPTPSPSGGADTPEDG